MLNLLQDLRYATRTLRTQQKIRPISASWLPTRRGGTVNPIARAQSRIGGNHR